ncbi:hypothetical protein Tco_1372109, partial [Tanacetum coccineum]
LKGVQSLTPEEQEAVDVMQDLKESKKTNKRQPGTRGSSEGTGRIPGVPDESIVVSATSSEGTGRIPGVPDESIVVSATSSEGTSTKPGVLDKEKVLTEEKVILEWGSEQESKYSEEDLNLEMIDDEETDDEVLQGEEQVNDNEDEDMSNAKMEESRNDDEEATDAAKADAEKTEEAKDYPKKAKLPPKSSSLSIRSLLDIKIQSEVPHIQSSSVLKVHVFVIFEPPVLTPVQETPLAALVTTLTPPSISTIPPAPLQQSTAPIPSPPIITDAPTITTAVIESNALFAVQQRVAKLEKDVSKLKKIDHSTNALSTLKSQVTMVVEQYLGSKIGDDLQKVL